MCASARAIGAREKFDTIWLRGRGISTGRNGTPYGGVLGPGGSRVSGSPDVSIPGNCGEFGTVARRRYGKPVFRTPHGGVLSPGGSRVGGGPDASTMDSGGEFRTVARGRDAIKAHGGVLSPGGSRVDGSPDVSPRDSGGEFRTVARRRDGSPVFLTPHGGVLSPGGSRVGGSPNVLTQDIGGEFRTVARRRDAIPFFCTPHGDVLSPGGSRVGGSPDVSHLDSGGEFGTVARRRDGIPVFHTPYLGEHSKRQQGDEQNPHNTLARHREDQTFDLENLAGPELRQRRYAVLKGDKLGALRNNTTCFDDKRRDYQKVRKVACSCGRE